MDATLVSPVTWPADDAPVVPREQRGRNPVRLRHMPVRKACTKKTPRCIWARNYNYALSECCRSNLIAIVTDLLALLRDEDIPVWTDYGTLLGAYRDAGRIIAHDKDADLGMMGADSERLRALEPRITGELKLDFVWKAPGKGGPFSAGDSFKIRWSRMNHTNVDLFCWYPGPKPGWLERHRYVGSIDRYKGREFPADKLLPLQWIDWETLRIPAPADPEWMCAHRYGPRWQTPIKANNDRVVR